MALDPVSQWMGRPSHDVSGKNAVLGISRRQLLYP